jgi:PelA/Pel-15E family pectate lyase
MTDRIVGVLLLACLLGPGAGLAAADKPRVIVLTDIENEPDDAQSLVRFLAYANQWDTEALVATTSVHQRDKVAAWRIREIVEAYGKVRDNLEWHDTGFPTADSLLSVIRDGRAAFGMTAVGQGMDSPGSDRIVEVVDRHDSRPVWVIVWGGPNCLAQALWKVRATRPSEAVDRFVAKLRVYTISDQDDSGPWIRKEFPALFYITSPGYHAGGAYHHATWSGISGDYFHGRFVGADFSLVSNEWLDRNIRSKGPLGTQYPRWEFLMEGDTPSFLNLIANGLSDPEHPNWGGWGGRYEHYTPPVQKWHAQPESRPIWTDAEDEVLGADGRWHTDNHATIWRWREAYQNDFAARMDWTIQPYAKANHPPVPTFARPLELVARPGERVRLSAGEWRDPDGDAMSYHWFYYPEAGTLTVSSGRDGQPVPIQGFDQQSASFTVPTGRVMPPGTGTMHFILAVTDHGTPRLTRYRRVIVTVVAASRPSDAPAVQERPIAWNDEVLRQPSAWYGSAAARTLADSVMRYQSAQGAWPKDTDLSVPPRSPDEAAPPGGDRANTIDNGATTLPMRFLAMVAEATGDEKYRASVIRGLDYLLAAQYPNGGWPQFYPLRDGYYSRITFNDNAMINVMTLLRDVDRGASPYGFVDGSRRAQAASAVARGITVILRTQIKQNGRLTAWCAQHDEKTLEPAWARAYEPPSTSGAETVGIVRFLMSVEQPTPEIIASVEAAVAWLRSVAMSGVRVDRIARADGRTERVLVRMPRHLRSGRGSTNSGPIVLCTWTVTPSTGMTSRRSATSGGAATPTTAPGRPLY